MVKRISIFEIARMISGGRLLASHKPSFFSTIRSMVESNEYGTGEDINHVGSYKTRHFDYSDEAKKLFDSGIPVNSNQVYVERLANIHDQLFNLAKKIEVNKTITSSETNLVYEFINKIIMLAHKIGLNLGNFKYLENMIINFKSYTTNSHDLKTLNSIEFIMEPGVHQPRCPLGNDMLPFRRKTIMMQHKVKTIDME